MTPTTVHTKGPKIRSFQIEIPQRCRSTTCTSASRRRAGPPRSWSPDRSQGVQFGHSCRPRSLLDEGDYDWRREEKKLNALPQFTTEIDGLEIHFVHVRSKEKNARPLLLDPRLARLVRRVLEKVVGPLTDPVAHGGKAEDAFHVVLPSLPGFGFSDRHGQKGSEHGTPVGHGWRS